MDNVSPTGMQPLPTTCHCPELQNIQDCASALKPLTQSSEQFVDLQVASGALPRYIGELRQSKVLVNVVDESVGAMGELEVLAAMGVDESMFDGIVFVVVMRVELAEFVVLLVVMAIITVVVCWAPMRVLACMVDVVVLEIVGMGVVPVVRKGISGIGLGVGMGMGTCTGLGVGVGRGMGMGTRRGT